MVKNLLIRFWPYLAILGLLGLTLLLGRRVVQVEEALKRQVETLEKQREMSNAGAATPRDPDSLSDSLRDGRF